MDFSYKSSLSDVVAAGARLLSIGLLVGSTIITVTATSLILTRSTGYLVIDKNSNIILFITLTSIELIDSFSIENSVVSSSSSSATW